MLATVSCLAFAFFEVISVQAVATVFMSKSFVLNIERNCSIIRANSDF